MSTTLALINLSLGDARSRPTLCPQPGHAATPCKEFMSRDRTFRQLNLRQTAAQLPRRPARFDVPLS